MRGIQDKNAGEREDAVDIFGSNVLDRIGECASTSGFVGNILSYKALFCHETKSAWTSPQRERRMRRGDANLTIQTTTMIVPNETILLCPTTSKPVMMIKVVQHMLNTYLENQFFATMGRNQEGDCNLKEYSCGKLDQV